jgi:hypothetical protein
VSGAFENRSGITATAEHAARELRRAEKLERRDPFDRCDAVLKSLEAERARADAEKLLTPPPNLVGERSTEVVPALAADENPSPARLYYADTLEHPNTISIDAAEQRACLATRANVLSPALDAAASAGARNSIEKMLCHQLAAVHSAGMDLLVRLEQTLVNLPPVERARLTNAAARMFEVYQSGCLTLQKLKTRGKQHVIVQHVNVGPGGQAVVAGRLSRGSRKRGAAPKTGDEPHER